MSHHEHDDSSRKGNGSRRPTQIMAEINHTRNEMDQTLSAIEHRLTPGQLVDQGLDYLRHSGAREYAANLGSSVKTNPLPVTLAGIGLAWMMATSNRSPQPASNEDGGPGIGERMRSAKDTLQSTKDSISGSMQSTKESLSSGVQSAKHSLSSGMQSARDRASQLSDTAGRQVDRARENWDYMLRENPLVLGAIGLAIGAVAAALAPRTRAEDQMMGEARDNLMDQAKQAGAAKLEEAKQAAESVKNTAVEAVKSKADAMKPDPANKPAQGQQQPSQGQKAPEAQKNTAAESPTQKAGGSDGEWPYAAGKGPEKAGDVAKQQPRPPSGMKR